MPCVLGHPKGESWSPCLPAKRRLPRHPEHLRLAWWSPLSSRAFRRPGGGQPLSHWYLGQHQLSEWDLPPWLLGGSAARDALLPRCLGIGNNWDLGQDLWSQWIQLAGIFCLACPAVIKLCLLKKLITCVSVFNTWEFYLKMKFLAASEVWRLCPYGGHTCSPSWLRKHLPIS